MKHLSLFVRSALCVAALGLGVSIVSCGGDDTGGTTPDANTGTPDGGGTANSGTYNHYATNTLKIGSSPGEATALAFNIDGKPGNDNSLGTFIAGLNANLMADAAIAAALTSGQFVILHSVRADDLVNDPTVSWKVLLGAPQANPKFDGTGTFTVAPNAPNDAIVNGSIVAGKFTGGPASVTIEIAFIEGADPIRVKLNAVRMEANVTATGCTNGRLGGAVEADVLLDDVAPVLATELSARIAADADCYKPSAPSDVSGCESSNATIRGLLDVNPKDGVISVAEISGEGSVVAVLFTPDVDILNAAGQPGTDGVAESVSLAVGFTCVKGTFTVTGE
jgi:hypothetical protein